MSKINNNQPVNLNPVNMGNSKAKKDVPKEAEVKQKDCSEEMQQYLNSLGTNHMVMVTMKHPNVEPESPEPPVSHIPTPKDVEPLQPQEEPPIPEPPEKIE